MFWIGLILGVVIGSFTTVFALGVTAANTPDLTEDGLPRRFR